MDKRRQCIDCDGAGGACSICHETPDNCDHPDPEVNSWTPCETCRGEGDVDADDEDEDDDDGKQE